MDKIFLANWIKAPFNAGDSATEFSYSFNTDKKIKSAYLFASAMGVYSARVNGERVSYVLAPGWTSFLNRVQYQKYDVTSLISKENTISVIASVGWRMLRRRFFENPEDFIKKFNTNGLRGDEYAVIAALEIEYENGESELIVTDEKWTATPSKWRFCDIYDGDIYDENYIGEKAAAKVIDHPKNILIPQEGEEIGEHEIFKPIALIHTPKGETVLDFGQDLTGYVTFTLCVPKGEKLVIDHGEVLDSDGNFYNANYRSAKAQIVYTGDGNKHTFKPELTFYGFRYIRLTEIPCDFSLDDFSAIVVHSNMERTGYFECSDSRINQLYHNVIWGQKGNFVDVPSDCPQRDERLGWTGDTQVFCKAASYNFDTRKFYKKWLNDLIADQRPSGAVPNIIPRIDWASCSAGWGDVCVILPWQLYLMYGEKDILQRQYLSIKKWIDYIYLCGDDYINRGHFGDWLSLDNEYLQDDTRYGSTDKRFLALAYTAYSTDLFIKISKILDVREELLQEYIEKLENTKKRLQNDFFKNGIVNIPTQTAFVLTLQFNLCDEDMLQAHADKLAQMIRDNGNRLTTGFLGTPYILHVLTQFGYVDIAYELLFQTKLPSWLYAVEHGATTLWEHWDSINDEGTMWSTDMNSYNHCGWGSIADWLYGTVAGIQPDEEKPGFTHIRFCPIPCDKLTYAKAEYKTKFGTVKSQWERENGKITYKFLVPSGLKGTAEIGGKSYDLDAGEHIFTE